LHSKMKADEVSNDRIQFIFVYFVEGIIDRTDRTHKKNVRTVQLPGPPAFSSF
jgi:hypothetical protein